MVYERVCLIFLCFLWTSWARFQCLHRYSCGRGEFFNDSSRECTTCPEGYFKDREGCGRCQMCAKCDEELQTLNKMCTRRECNATVDRTCKCCPGYYAKKVDGMDAMCLRISSTAVLQMTDSSVLAAHIQTSVVVSTLASSAEMTSSVLRQSSHFTSPNPASVWMISPTASTVSKITVTSTVSMTSSPGDVHSQGEGNDVDVLVIVSITLGMLVFIVVTVSITVCVVMPILKRKGKRSSEERAVHCCEDQSPLLIVQATDSADSLSHQSEPGLELGVVDSQEDREDGANQRGGDPAEGPEPAMPPGLSTVSLSMQMGDESHQSDFNASGPSSLPFDAELHGPIQYVRDIPVRTREKIGIVISDSHFNHCHFPVLGDILGLTKEDITQLRVHVQNIGPVGNPFFHLLQCRRPELTVDQLCVIVRSLGRMDLADDIRMWIKEDCSLIEGCIPDSGCIIQPSTT